MAQVSLSGSAVSGVAGSVVLPEQLGSPVSRLLAVIIDTLIASVLFGIGWGTGLSSIIMAANADETGGGGMGLGIIGAIFGLIAVAFLVYQAYLLTTKGQTIGKQMMGLKVVLRTTGQNGGFVPNVLLRVIVNGVLSAIPFYSIVDAVLIFRADRRCIHDMIANTQVVKA